MSPKIASVNLLIFKVYDKDIITTLFRDHKAVNLGILDINWSLWDDESNGARRLWEYANRFT